MPFYGKSAKSNYVPKKLIKAGDYEARITDCGENFTEGGEPYVFFTFQIRGDVEQDEKGTSISKKFFPEAKERDARKINSWAYELGVDEGVEYLLSDFIGMCCLIHISHFVNQESGREMQYVAYIAPSKAGDSAKTVDAGGFSDYGADDIPF